MPLTFNFNSSTSIYDVELWNHVYLVRRLAPRPVETRARHSVTSNTNVVCMSPTASHYWQQVGCVGVGLRGLGRLQLNGSQSRLECEVSRLVRLLELVLVCYR